VGSASKEKHTVTRAVTVAAPLGGTANRGGGRQRTDKAEARRAASAKAAFPSRRAREESVPEKVTGLFLWPRLN
jgi:hypothetical protein